MSAAQDNSEIIIAPSLPGNAGTWHELKNIPSSFVFISFSGIDPIVLLLQKTCGVYAQTGHAIVAAQTSEHHLLHQMTPFVTSQSIFTARV